MPISQTILNLIIVYKYWLLFPLAAFEGPLISLLCGFLVFQGYLSFLPSFLILILGDLVPDIAYYYLGRYGDKKQLIAKYGTKHKFISKNFDLVDNLWRDHGRKTMFLSKLAYGLSTIFLISAGLVKMPVKRFISYALPITIIQYGVLLTAGYYLGHSYALAETYFKAGSYAIAVILIIFVAGYIIASKYARKKIIALEKEEQEK